VWKAALRWAGALAGLAGLVAAGFWTAAAAGRAPELAVSRIRVEGNERLAEGEILEALGLHPGSNILNLDLEVLKKQLLRSPWVKDVQLTRVLPATLTLRIVERAPVGVAVLDRLYLIDDEGTFLDEIGPRYADLAPPLVRGIADETGNVVVERTELAGRVLKALVGDERLESVVSEIDVSEGSGSVRIHLRHPPLTILLEEDDLVGRLREMLPLSEAILDRFPALLAVDLRYEGRVYLQLPPGDLGEGEMALNPAVNGGR
jgi:cell division protein FtsQ